MARRYRVLALVLAVMLLAACSSSSRDSYDGSDDSYSPPGDETSENVPGDIVRHVIYEARLRLSVKDLNEAVDQLTRRATEVGGYVSGSVRENHPERPSANITYRVPQPEYAGFLVFAGSLGNAEHESVSSTDVTEEFVDLEARLTNRQLHEERLTNMFAQANTIDELIVVERELVRVREDIERLQGRLRYLSENIAMSTVEVYLYQTQGETQIPGLGPVGINETLRRALKALVNSSTLFLDFISFIFVALFAALPFAVPVGLVTFVILRRRRKSKNVQS